MIPAARISAAVEILADIDARHRPAADALKDWGLGHRFAGSGDRAAIASLVFDALRRKASSAWIMGDATPRSVMLGALREVRGLAVADIAALCSGAPHAPAPLSEVEQQRLENGTFADAPVHVRGDFPEWLAPYFLRLYGEAAEDEGRALAARAPFDLRVNTLKVSGDKALAALAHLRAEATSLSPSGLRLPLASDGRGPPLKAEPAYIKGLVEVQDEGSQLAALLCGAEPGMQILDLCAGAGGKTLALAAMTENRGQIYATDSDGRRLGPIFARLDRAGARNVQVRAPQGTRDVLADLAGRCDIVVVDAPCTGIGTWRRNPDAKWRMRPAALEQRLKEQDQVLEEATRFVKEGGRLAYITCTLLAEENEDRIAGFLSRHTDFLPLDAGHLARRAGLPDLAECASPFGAGLRLTPRANGTDGFYVAVLVRR
jgi:16S rRNA (cytosine967-C5)-methyltransferase